MRRRVLVACTSAQWYLQMSWSLVTSVYVALAPVNFANALNPLRAPCFSDMKIPENRPEPLIAPHPCTFFLACSAAAFAGAPLLWRSLRAAVQG